MAMAGSVTVARQATPMRDHVAKTANAPMDGVSGDVGNALLLEHTGSRPGRCGVAARYHRLDTLAEQFVSDRHRLFGR
jgi:hypothetical protein